MQLILVITEKCQMLRKKIYHYQIYHCLKVKPSFHERLFQKEKNKLLLWIYARRLSNNLCFNGRENRRSPASTETPWTVPLISYFLDITIKP